MSEEDEELEDLLDELSAIGPLPSEELKNKVDKKVEEQKAKEEKYDIHIPAGSLELIEDDEKDDHPTKMVEQEEVNTEDVADELTGQLKKAVGKFDEITEEILSNYHKDREQAQKAIDHYFNTINSGNKVPRVYIEKLADVIRSKNEIAQTPIRLLDSITKFLTATNKSNGIMINNVNQGGGTDMSNLEALLKQAETYEDEQ